MHEDKLRVLLVAPEAPGLAKLAWAEELSQIAEIDDVRLEVCAGKVAVRAAVAARLHEWWDCVLWSGHGAAGRLMLADGPVGSEWLACMVRQAPPGVLVLSACLSGARDAAALQSITETLSSSGVTSVGMWVSVEDRAAVAYDVEFVRALASGAKVMEAHRIGVQQMALESPAMAGAAFLVPGLANGNARIYTELGEIRKRLEVVEGKVDRVLRGPVG